MKLKLEEIKQKVLDASECTLICCPGLEDRSVVFPICLDSPATKMLYFRMVGDGLIDFDRLEDKVLVRHGEQVFNCIPLDRLDPTQQWTLLWSNIRALSGNIVVDATSFSREALGMILYALAIINKNTDSVSIVYASPHSYVEPLSEGVIGSRTILGYAGRFRAEWSRHFIGLVGFEEHRMLEAISSVEPEFVSLGNEDKGTETYDGFTAISDQTLGRLKFHLGSYDVNHFKLNAQDLFQTKSRIEELVRAQPDTNVILSGMNTKISFIGITLAALQNRSLRLMYTLPCRYSQQYSHGVGNTFLFDISEELNKTDLSL